VNTIDEVRTCFKQMYRAYWAGCERLAEIGEHEERQLVTELYERRIPAWRDLHRDFFDKTADMVEIPEHHKTLHIFVWQMPASPFKAFMQAAEHPRREAQ
jgi:hypothetical protein